MIRRAGIVAAIAVVALASLAEAQLADLERRAKSFYDLLERGQKEQAAATFPGLESALATALKGYQDRLDQMRDEVIARDGDVEGLYRQQRFREPEVAQLVVTYHLAWVRYQGAQLTTDTRKKNALLEKAAEGFSNFLVVDDVPEVYAESLYGRGLAFLDLGNFTQAREDLQAAAKNARTAGKAKSALAELERRQAGKKAAAPPPEDDPEALLARLVDSLPKAGDPAVEKDLTALARGLAARGGDWPRRVEGAIATKLGDGTPAGVKSSYGLALLAQLAIDRGRCAEIAPLAAASATVQDAGRARHRPEILFLDGGCRLNAGKSREAAEIFGTLLGEFPNAARSRDAAYYRFRALDVARRSEPALDRDYEEALRTFASRFPKDDAAGEAHYQLGELQRARADCPAADAEYAKVAVGAYAARARLGSLECATGAFVKAGKNATPEARTALIERLRTFVRDVPAKGPDEQAVARAALMGGLLASDAKPADPAAVIAFLDDYEKRYPNAKEWHATVVDRRLVARVALGDLAAAEKDLDAFVATVPADEQKKTLSDLGRTLQRQLDADDETKRATAAALARKVYARLIATGGDGTDRIALADLELRAGDAAEAKRRYEEVLAKDPGSAEAMRGAARAAEALGDRAAAIARWKQVLDSSSTGGTAWYEARIAQVKLFLAAGDTAQACEVIRLSAGKSTTTGGDQLDKQLRALGAESCR